MENEIKTNVIALPIIAVLLIAVFAIFSGTANIFAQKNAELQIPQQSVEQVYEKESQLNILTQAVQSNTQEANKLGCSAQETRKCKCSSDACTNTCKCYETGKCLGECGCQSKQVADQKTDCGCAK